MPDVLPGFEAATEAAEFIAARTSLRPKVAVVLGSGLGDFATELTDSTTIPYREIPNFPHSTAVGHAGNLVLGKLGSLPLAVMQGRAHYYEGNALAQAAFPARVGSSPPLADLVLASHRSGSGSGFAPEPR